jgi:hypothetical protein
MDAGMRRLTIVVPFCLPARVVTSSRRWERDGVWRTILFMADTDNTGESATAYYGDIRFRRGAP